MVRRGRLWLFGHVTSFMESCKNRVPRKAQPIDLFRHFCFRMYHLVTMHSVRDKQTDRQHYHANSWSVKTKSNRVSLMSYHITVLYVEYLYHSIGVLLGLQKTISYNGRIIAQLPTADSWKCYWKHFLRNCHRYASADHVVQQLQSKTLK